MYLPHQEDADTSLTGEGYWLQIESIRPRLRLIMLLSWDERDVDRNHSVLSDHPINDRPAGQ